MKTPYRYRIKCRKCGKDMSIVELYFTRTTLILFWVVCVKCNVDEQREGDFLEIQADIRKTEETTVIEGTETIQ